MLFFLAVADRVITVGAGRTGVKVAVEGPLLLPEFVFRLLNLAEVRRNSSLPVSLLSHRFNDVAGLLATCSQKVLVKLRAV